MLAKEVGHLGIHVCTLEPGGMRTDWGRTARASVDITLADYDASVGRVLRLLRAYAGQEVGDPAKIAALIVELSRRDDLPLRLLLGGDALYVCEQAEAERTRDRQKWRATTLSTHFPDARLPEGLDELKRYK